MCGDDFCDGDADETCLTCADDCGACEGDCCADNGTTGCDDLTVTACVCGQDPFCCETTWDALCAQQADEDCGQYCPVCGDGICDPEVGEDCSTCADDCGACEGGCCDDNQSAGCEDQGVTSCVCAIDAFCCDNTWDGLCVEAAIGQCGLACPECGDGTCDAQSGESCSTCPGDCAVCDDCGDGACDADSGESCGTCPTDCGGCAGDCCDEDGNVSPGCDDADVSSCVCLLDSYCCDLDWDSLCVEQGQDECGLYCPECGDAICDPEVGEDCVSCHEDCGVCDGDCCDGNGSVGCDDPAVTACVCEIDPFCCDTEWDGLCASAANSDCGAACPVCGNGSCDTDEGEGCDTCPDDCGACVGDCCAAEASAGCEDPTTTACVCGEDAFCCQVEWDATCVLIATETCGHDCSLCGDASCDAGSGEHCATCAEDCGACDGDCCEDNGTVGCDDPTTADCVCGFDSFCCEVTWDTACVDIAVAECGVGCPVCGDGSCDVEDGESCLSCALDCGSCEGDCCEANGSAGCGDEAVTSCVCALDPFCCQVDWDAICVGEAVEDCGSSCPICGDASCEAGETCSTCPEDCEACVGDCCDGNGTPGCDDPLTTDCVCALDTFCCEVTWDPTCVDEAVGDCGHDCSACGDGSCDSGSGESCSSCPEDCGACSGACCDENLSAGCDDPTVTACVCAADPFCCDVDWDGLCVEAAVVDCGLACPTCGDGVCDPSLGEMCATCPEDCPICTDCGDGVCDATIDESCGNCAADCGACAGDCCAENDSPGCEDGLVTPCMCLADPYCCDFHWDSLCVETAVVECGLYCPECGDALCDGAAAEDCVSCTADCGDCVGDCCASNGTIGCEDPAVQACVCDIDPFCCAVTWDAICVGGAQLDCDACPPCGDGLCDEAIFEGCHNCEEDCGVCAGDCCEAGDEAGCDEPLVSGCVCAQDAYCCAVEWDGLCVEIATDACELYCASCGDGSCNIEVGEDCATCPVDCGSPCPTCGDGTCDPDFDEDCGTCPLDCGFCEGECCETHVSPGCEDPFATQCVCDADPYCCDLFWDQTCVEEASDLCGVVCATCGDGTCEAPADPVVWDLDIVDFAFPTFEQVVTVGDTVRWTHQGSAPHTVTADDLSFNSGTLSGGETFEFTFDTLGVHDYFCGFHPSMVARIVVVPASASGDETPESCPEDCDPCGDGFCDGPPPPVTWEVDIAGFVLPELSIAVGDTVIWTNVDGAPHTATSDDGVTFDTGLLFQNDGSAPLVFDTPGVFPYHCDVHPSMTATLTVSPAGGGPETCATCATDCCP